MTEIKGKERSSGIELFRIITMFLIVAHHYVVNSGILPMVMETKSLSGNDIFLLLFGWGGKTGINCFLLITGYFMCTSKITWKKYLKLLLWVEFYKILFYLIFVITGYQTFALESLVKVILPITSVAKSFTSSYLLFYLFIPFLNILIHGMKKKEHLLLIALCVGSYTVFATLLFEVAFNYVIWFSIIYLIGAYIRLYPEKWFENRTIIGWGALLSVLLSWASVLGISALTLRLFGEIKQPYFLVSDSNMPLALLTAVFGFLFFKNLNLGENRIINRIAASAFGVLLIHAGSSTMRTWLWQDTLHVTEQYGTPTLVLHAILSVLGIYLVATIIDMLRIKFLEKPLFTQIDKKVGRD